MLDKKQKNILKDIIASLFDKTQNIIVESTSVKKIKGDVWKYTKAPFIPIDNDLMNLKNARRLKIGNDIYIKKVRNIDEYYYEISTKTGKSKFSEFEHDVEYILKAMRNNKDLSLLKYVKDTELSKFIKQLQFQSSNQQIKSNMVAATKNANINQKYTEK